MTKGKFGDSKASSKDLKALDEAERIAAQNIKETPPPPRGVDTGLVDIDDRDN